MIFSHANEVVCVFTYCMILCYIRDISEVSVPSQENEPWCSCVLGVFGCVYFHDFDILFWNCSDIEIFFVFHFNSPRNNAMGMNKIEKKYVTTTFTEKKRHIDIMHEIYIFSANSNPLSMSVRLTEIELFHVRSDST